MKLLPDVGLSFDDVLLVPRYSTIKSRFSEEIDTSVEILPGLKIKYPLVAANMDRICDGNMASKLVELGCLGIVHRFLTPEEQAKEIAKIPAGYRIGCIGVGQEATERLNYLANFGYELNGVLVDVAHGHSILVEETIKWIKKQFPSLPIIAGSVATKDAAMSLTYLGVHCIKVGVGCGSRCSTRLQVGNGVPQITAIEQARKGIEEATWIRLGQGKRWVPTLMCDGGIKNSGDFVKALAAGSDVVMSGYVFAGTEETPGEKIVVGNKEYKNYRGSASRELQKDWKNKNKNISVEGISSLIPYKGPIEPILNVFFACVKSGFSYQGARTVKELQRNATFIQMTSAGYIESTPRD